MLTITVAQDGSGDFASVSEAVLAVPYACAAEIRIGPGVYREKLVCEKQDITLIGAGMESTRIVWGDGGSLPHPDGRPTHTFRSYTAFFRGIELRVRDLTIENDAGPGAKVGQAVAAYVDCAHTRRARCFWAGHGGPPVKRLCWTAVWEPTLHRKAFRPGRAAPTPTLPALPKRAAPARAQQRAVHG